MRPLPPIAEQQCGVFATFQAYRVGWTPSTLSRAVRAGDLVRLRRGAHQIADLSHLDEYEQQRWRHAGPGVGAALTTPGARVSHSTAAVLYGLPLLFLPSRACVVVPSWLTGEVPAVHLHRCTGDRSQNQRGTLEATTVAQP